MVSQKHRHSFQQLDVEQQKQIDAVCDTFEKEWRNNQAYRVEDIQDQLHDSWRNPATEELIILEVELRFTNNTDPSKQEYLKRFPKFGECIDQAFERIAEIDGDELANSRSLDQTRLNASTKSIEVDNNDFQLKNDSSFSKGQSIPDQIGEFSIKEQLGSGAFGVVHRAIDENNNREVALKFPLSFQHFDSQIRADFIREAKSTSRLHHPGIVETFEVRQDEEMLFLVQQLVNGEELKTYIKTPIGQREAVKLVADVADAVGYAHRQGIYHRDLKPSNILIDQSGKPLVTDFGMAIHESVQYRRRGERAGSPAYMSPELVRGESHLIDGRSDIWSLGVILYELLVGRRPFSEESISALFDQIKIRETIPLRQIDETVPVEIERICLRCLSKKIGDRYLTASDLADELRRWLDSPGLKETAVEDNDRLVPQGLRAFGADDADGFVRLLPGPRHRPSMPNSVWFWKKRIESTAPETTFSTGLLYGPSGSGKSSFVRAGILPRLSENVLPIYVEATARDTEVRVLKAIRQHMPNIPLDCSLPEVMAGLRERRWNRSYSKVLLIFDQFEQWLHSHDITISEQLIEALRQCDGKSLQCLILVRDDFWLATSRFKDALEIEFVDGHNAMLIDRFDKIHARKVLGIFGSAFHRLPHVESEWTPEQHQFLDRVIDDLSEEGHVISVRLALFAEMFKDRDWTTPELQKVGGISGLGETFLEESFSRKNSSPRYRSHSESVRVILEKLLPDSMSNIKGMMRTDQELAEECGIDPNDPAFRDIITILVKELRLITPTEPDSAASGSNTVGKARSGKKHYQLTHDYLVLPIRNWLNRKKKESWKGRAALRLNELATLHQQSQDNRFLPNLAEHVRMRAAVPSRIQSVPEKQLLKKASRRHALILGAWGLAGATMLGVGNVIRRNMVEEKVDGLVDRLVEADPFTFESVFNELAPYRKQAQSRIVEFHDDADRKKRVNSLATSIRWNPTKEAIEKLANEIEELSGPESRLLGPTLVANPKLSVDVLKSVFESTQSVKRKNRCATLLMNLGERNPLLEYSTDPSLRTEWIHQFAKWPGDLTAAVNVLSQTEEASTLSGLLIALSEVDEGELNSQLKHDVQEKANEIYAKHPEACCHAAAEYFLKRAGSKISTPVNIADANWRSLADDIQINMVLVPQGTLFQGHGIPEEAWQPKRMVREETPMQPFWVSDKEISVELFDQFLACNDYRGPKPTDFTKYELDPKKPITNVSSIEAAMFCDWLNWKTEKVSGLTYTKNSLVCDLSKNGFRLPTREEMEYCSRAGTNTTYFFGNLAQRKYLNQYVWIAANSNSITSVSAQPTGTRIPNQFGVFDSLGNVSELCLLDIARFEKRNGLVEEPVKGKTIVEYGSNYVSSSSHFCGWYGYLQPGTKRPTVGFRVVCP